MGRSTTMMAARMWSRRAGSMAPSVRDHDGGGKGCAMETRGREMLDRAFCFVS
jgi:hypothetical protein